PGVLVLSQFAGAAEELTEALIVNPYDIDEMARQLHRAREMPLEERRERHAALRRKVFQQDARTWLSSFIAVLERAGKANDDALAGDLADQVLPDEPTAQKG